MNEQPEALRLADALDDLMWEEILIGGVHIGRASYELRRLHAENERLREEVKAEREACAKVCDHMKNDIYNNSQEDTQPMAHAVANFCAEAIRARGEV